VARQHVASIQLKKLRPTCRQNNARQVGERRREMKVYGKAMILALIVALPFASCAVLYRTLAGWGRRRAL
jgi:hypothetical protein